MDVEIPSMEHSNLFITTMPMYKIPGSAGEEEGFKTLDNVAMGIDHYEHYSECALAIEKNKWGRYCQYGCRIHENFFMYH